MYETSSGRKLRKLNGEDREPKGMPILVMHDRWTEKVIAHVIQEKGVHDYAVGRLELEIRNLGYKRVVLKSDQERSIKALLQHVTF